MPGIKHDTEKLRYDLLPVSALRGDVEVLTYGARKYADRNWELGLSWGRCYGAAMRHLTAWWGGETLDPESGLSHLKHARANLMFLIEFEETHRELDDRPRRLATDPGNSGSGHLDVVRRASG